MTIRNGETRIPNHAEVAALLERGTEAEIRAAVQDAITAKKVIEDQLAGSKAGMLERRSGFMNRGFGPKEAQQRASADTEWDWRRRATAAARAADICIGQLRARLVTLSGGSGGSAARREAWIVRGTVDEVVAHINDVLSRGGYVNALAAYEGAVIVVGQYPMAAQEEQR